MSKDLGYIEECPFCKKSISYNKSDRKKADKHFMLSLPYSPFTYFAFSDAQLCRFLKKMPEHCMAVRYHKSPMYYIECPNCKEYFRINNF